MDPERDARHHRPFVDQRLAHTPIVSLIHQAYLG
jgi:hypothetical protein